MGYRIFMLCLRQLFSNLKIAIQLSWAWIVVLLVAGIGFAVFLAGAAAGGLGTGTFILLFLFALVFVILAVLGAISIAVGWHRYVLREELPPSIHLINLNWPLASYWWKSFKIALLFIIIFLPLSFFAVSIIPSIFSTIGTQSNNIIALTLVLWVFMLPLNFFFFWLLLRVGLVLPATAVDERMTIADSFKYTSGHGWQLLITAVLLTVFYSAPSILLLPFHQLPTPGDLEALQLYSGANLILQLVNAVFTWITFFVSFGILTVLYGHLCEERPI